MKTKVTHDMDDAQRGGLAHISIRQSKLHRLLAGIASGTGSTVASGVWGPSQVLMGGGWEDWDRTRTRPVMIL